MYVIPVITLYNERPVSKPASRLRKGLEIANRAVTYMQ